MKLAPTVRAQTVARIYGVLDRLDECSWCGYITYVQRFHEWDGDGHRRVWLCRACCTGEAGA